jgi:hypothetical protein
LILFSFTAVPAFLRSDLDAFRRDAPQGVYLPYLHVASLLLLTCISLEFTQCRLEVFKVFSGQGLTALRHYLNRKTGIRNKAEFDGDEVTLTRDGCNHTTTGMMSAAALDGRKQENKTAR